MIIGNEFIEVFAEEARKLDGIEFLAQGTITWKFMDFGTADKKCQLSQSPISFPRIVPAASAEDPQRGSARSWGEEEAVGAPPGADHLGGAHST